MPADYGLGLHDEEGVLPVRPPTAQRDPECAVQLPVSSDVILALHNGQLLSQGEVLERELALFLRLKMSISSRRYSQVKHQEIVELDPEYGTPTIAPSTGCRETARSLRRLEYLGSIARVTGRCRAGPRLLETYHGVCG